MIPVKEWIDGEIKDKYIRYFEYDEFSQVTEIGKGGFGIVSKAELANKGLVALKRFVDRNSNIEDEFINEVRNAFISYNILKLYINFILFYHLFS